MVRPNSAVLFAEQAIAAECTKPLMLEAILSCPILTWMSNQLLADGVRRFFVVCEPHYQDEVRACFAPEATVVVSDRQEDLMSFLNTPDPVLVLNRSAFPLQEAGAGFAYAAPGYELQEAWKEKMTNAVQGAELVPGWLPIFGPETIAEVEQLMRRQTEAEEDG